MMGGEDQLNREAGDLKTSSHSNVEPGCRTMRSKVEEYRKAPRVENALTVSRIKVRGIAYDDGASKDIVAQAVLELMELGRKLLDDAKRQRLAVEASNLVLLCDQPVKTIVRLAQSSVNQH
jgi:hypothetical protein